jgi:SAM-dependent methyltransferase
MEGDARLQEDRKAQTLAINKAQAQYYDQANGSKPSGVNSWMTNLWRTMRYRAIGSVFKQNKGVIHAIQKDWMGDISQAKILELGSGSGSFLTKYMAENCGIYHAVDLSAVKMAELRGKFGHIPHARFFVADFLSDAFSEGDYDIIFAQSVIHHFRYTDVLFDKIDAKLKAGGRVITFDPLQTWLPARIFRSLYRPFQTDSAWEFPFTHRMLDDIARRYTVLDQFGIFGRAKWALIIGILAPGLGARLGDKWFQSDFDTGYVRRHVRSCLMVACHLQVRTATSADAIRGKA